jgi:hypothetical protein
MRAADSRSRTPYAIEELTVTLDRSRLGAGWRWRSELLCLACLLAAYGWVWSLLGSGLRSLAVFGVIALVLALIPWSRRFITGRFWALFTRHRLQRAFWELRLHTRAGRLPLIPWITSTAVGSRAVVVIRAGMCFEDFEGKAAELAAACGAREARVTCSSRWSWLVFIDIIRRDVLGPARVIRSPLADLPARVPGHVPALASASDPGPSWPLPPRAEDD